MTLSCVKSLIFALAVSHASALRLNGPPDTAVPGSDALQLTTTPDYEYHVDWSVSMIADVGSMTTDAELMASESFTGAIEESTEEVAATLGVTMTVVVKSITIVPTTTTITTTAVQSIMPTISKKKFWRQRPAEKMMLTSQSIIVNLTTIVHGSAAVARMHEVVSDDSDGGEAEALDDGFTQRMETRGISVSDAEFIGEPKVTQIVPIQTTTGGQTSASGDPHVTNYKGEKFDILQTGTVPLINIYDGNTVLLEVKGLVERFGAAAATACVSTFFTEIMFDGAWVNNKLVTVRATGRANKFSMIVDGQPATLPYGHNTTTKNKKQVVLDARGEKLPFEKFVPSYISNENDPHQIRFDGQGNIHGITMIIRERSNQMSMNLGFLNFAMNGLDKLKGNKIGGLLGDDDHSKWTATDDECKHAKAKFVDISHSNEDQSFTGSILYASK